MLRDGDLIAIDGTTGQVTFDDVPLVTPEGDPRFQTVLGWCDELRALGVRANADTTEVDEQGVGALVRMAAERGRAARPGLEVGICGEHGGDPDSIGSATRPGWTTSAARRPPIARVAAAQAATLD